MCDACQSFSSSPMLWRQRTFHVRNAVLSCASGGHRHAVSCLQRLVFKTGADAGGTNLMLDGPLLQNGLICVEWDVTLYSFTSEAAEPIV